MILYTKRITKALISLRGCACWSVPLLSANPRRQVFSCRGQFNVGSISTICMLGNFACFLLSMIFFQNQLLRKNLSEIPSNSKTAKTVRGFVGLNLSPDFWQIKVITRQQKSFLAMKALYNAYIRCHLMQVNGS